jgi:competence ComEA-like helix-hairpin-helix protein
MKSLVYLNKKERRGLLVLLILLSFFMGIKIVMIYFPTSGDSYEFDSIDWDTLNTKPLISNQKRFTYPSSSTFNPKKIKPKYKVDSRPKVLFPFNPNEISEDSLKLLPINNFARKNLLKYRASGGKIIDKEGFKKIYSLSTEEFIKLEPFLRFPQIELRIPYKSKVTLIKLDLNSSSENDFQRLPGIGPVLSKRIVKFRDNLGGFHSKQQLGEVFGLPDSTFHSIIDLIEIKTEIRKININVATEKELGKHPYLSYKTARLIVNYKKQHGPFNNVEDLLKIKVLSSELVDKIAVYLSFNN